MNRLRALLIWAILATILAVPLLAAAASPLLQWRQPIYIAAGFAGITAMALLLLQPLLAGGYLPGAEGLKGRRLHRWTGSLLVLAIILHVGGLWITSPPPLAPAAHPAGHGDRRRQRGSCAVDRGHYGDILQSSTLRAGRSRDGEGDF